MAKQQAVGIVGIGQLHPPIVTSFIAAGLGVVGNRRNDRDQFVKLGEEALSRPAEVAKFADSVLLCLPSEEVQLNVLNGPRGLPPTPKAGQASIEPGTYSREYKIARAARIEGTGAAILETESSGSPPMVADRRATRNLVRPAVLDGACEPAPDAISAHHFHLGEFGFVVTMDPIAQCLVTIHTLAAA